MAVHTINLAVYPQMLTVAPGDRVRVVTEFDYVGPALSARMISAIWHPSFFDPHDEIVRGNKSFSIPSSPSPGNHITVTMDLLVPSGEVGTDYGLYSSIRDVPGPDIYSGYYPNIITIEEVVPDFKGTISKKELEYNESQRAIPVSNIPQDERGLVHVWGRNAMATSQKLGIRWIVKNPYGTVVEDYQDWEFGTTGPGGDHHFIGGRFDLNKPGTWTISISLAMNPTSPLTVASYAGVLCTVKEAAPTTFHLSVLVPAWATGGYVQPGSGDYPTNTTITLRAYPLSGYQFVGWGRDASGTSSTYNLYMNSDKNVEAYFEKVPVAEYTLEVTVEPPGAGYVSISPRKAAYSAGEKVTLTAYPYSGYEFDHWGGWPPYPGIQSTSRSIQIAMTANWWVVAAFQKVTAPPTQGTISKKELEYNESQRAIPVSNIPQDERGLVHVWGRNAMATSQKLGIRWIVKNPYGTVVEDYQDWEFGTTGPGGDHHFIGGRFDLNKPGTWTIAISLAMNPTSPLTVDSYAGVLCTVT